MNSISDGDRLAAAADWRW